MTTVCTCDEAQEEHEHCEECGCVLTSHESETHCRWCEAPMGEGKAEVVRSAYVEKMMWAADFCLIDRHLSEMPQSIRNVKEFVEYYMGSRCPECEPECPACKAWAAVDHLDRLVQEMTDEFINKEINELGNVPNKTDSKGETK